MLTSGHSGQPPAHRRGGHGIDDAARGTALDVSVSRRTGMHWWGRCGVRAEAGGASTMLFSKVRQSFTEVAMPRSRLRLSLAAACDGARRGTMVRECWVAAHNHRAACDVQRSWALNLGQAHLGLSQSRRQLLLGRLAAASKLLQLLFQSVLTLDHVGHVPGTRTCGGAHKKVGRGRGQAACSPIRIPAPACPPPQHAHTWSRKRSRPLAL